MPTSPEENLQEQRQQVARHTFWWTIVPTCALLTLLLGIVGRALFSLIEEFSQNQTVSQSLWIILGIIVEGTMLGILAGIIHNWLNLKYLFIVQDCQRANVLELASWMSTDPYWASTLSMKQHQQQLVQFMQTHQQEFNDPLVSLPTSELFQELLQRLHELDEPGKFVHTMLLFDRLMYKYPKQWWNINEAYRETMNRLAHGEDPSTIKPAIQIGRHMSIVITNLEDVCEKG